ncbi:PIG-P [Ochromonadaceae sp. CCMP2298]|nr:PIG-P [Ochromonadaceae sp. CCMP2298]|eukprot:CAMPEP_0173187010 /NCGR_PEP_ID=MMETSP1141-20130122/10457_1 /TAXON_ID=483371 /ORGANISM="non described non described, Strain CCMP2298" /LENGTH=146 /DNA_ID=CAMNT_0014110771 /DNA_START=72 /DNA_END=512 /DNA_ORIENTATION=+
MRIGSESVGFQVAGSPSTKEIGSDSIYSFVGWISTIFMYLVFLVWALVPKKMLYYIGVTYYPSRYYAVALPAFVIVTCILSGVSYIAYNLLGTLDPEDRRTFKDSPTTATASAQLRAPMAFIKVGSKDGIPDVGNLDMVQLTSMLT